MVAGALPGGVQACIWSSETGGLLPESEGYTLLVGCVEDCRFSFQYRKQTEP